MENAGSVNSDVYVYIINKYIQFYRKEINNVDFFEGMTPGDYGSTSESMEKFYTELEKYNKLEEEFKTVSNDCNKKYIITKNSKNFKASDSLLALLIEMYNLENEEPQFKFDIILKNKN
jgi:hypothetical protein